MTHRRAAALPGVLVVLLWIASAAALAQPSGARPGAATGPIAVPGPVITQYCVSCHSQRLKTGGLALEGLDTGNVAANADLWEKVARKVKTGAMPPPGARRPDAASADALVSSLEAALDRAASRAPDPGPSLLRRLNRAEYGNAIRDLLALDVDVGSLLPPDNSAHGFDNIADVLGLSPSLQERYLAAAEKISALAVGDRREGPSTETYRVRQDLSQNQHVEGLPLGTVGGTLVRHLFPLDGDYQFRAALYRTNFGNVRGIEHPRQIEIAIDGERIHSAMVGGYDDLAAAFEKPTDTADAIDARLSVRVPVKAGPHDVSIAFVESFPVADTNRLRPFLKSAHDTLDWTGRPHIQTLTITGAFNPTGPGDTPSRRRVFVCKPDRTSAERACARQIISTLARRAFRRSVTEEDLQPLLAFYNSGRGEGGFDTGIQRALHVILASPKFVFRVERSPASAPAGRTYRVGDFDLASRLSFFLWSSLPDDELLTAAANATLGERPILEGQVRRMLADPRAQALVSNFAGQWLQLRNVRSLLPNSDVFPDFDDNLRQAFRRETELLFESVIREDRSVLELITADYTFVNERLAKHYGIPKVYGSHFRRIPVTDDTRKGLLGHGSVLAVTSHATRTSPVVRGKWILENILGTPPAPPPPDVPALKENDNQAPRTMREQLAQHRADPACASCHKVMDPIGFALENFDAVGAWRTRDAGLPIDASGELTDGTPVAGVVTLREALVRRPDMFVGTMTEKLLTYALGRGVDSRDMPAVRAIVKQSAGENYRFSSLILGVVNSTPFRMKKGEDRAN